MDSITEKTKKKDQKESFFETMGAEIEKITQNRYDEEKKNIYKFSMDAVEQRRLVNKKLSVS